MGGFSGYDRDVYSSSDYGSSSGFYHSYQSAANLNTYYEAPARAVSRPVTPKPKPKPQVNFNPYERRLSFDAKVPIVLALDLTGSTRESAMLVYDKIPMFFGQVVDRKYLKDFGVSIAGVGDATCDRDPAQVFDYVRRKSKVTVMDTYLQSMHLEGGGGPGRNFAESFELTGYYYAFQVDYAQDTERGYFFFIGDEHPYEEIEGAVLRRVFGGKHKTISTAEVFSALSKRYNVYALCTPYRGGGFPEVDAEVRSVWQKYLPESTVPIREPKSVVDVMLGIIATHGGTRSVEDYVSDMRERDQTEDRVGNVEEAIRSMLLE